jgi:hypothetical protein
MIDELKCCRQVHHLFHSLLETTEDKTFADLKHNIYVLDVSKNLSTSPECHLELRKHPKLL